MFKRLIIIIIVIIIIRQTGDTDDCSTCYFAHFSHTFFYTLSDTHFFLLLQLIYRRSIYKWQVRINSSGLTVGKIFTGLVNNKYKDNKYKNGKVIMRFDFWFFFNYVSDTSSTFSLSFSSYFCHMPNTWLVHGLLLELLLLY